MRRAIIEKQKKVEELRNLIRQNKTIMIATMEGVPASMMQKIRKSLRGRAIIKVYKNVVIERALKGEGIEDLIPYVEGHPTTVILSNEDPVKLYREITSVEEYAPLRPGKPSPTDVVLKPGPVPVPITALSEIKAAGIPVKSVKGAVQLDEEFVAVRAGEVADEKIAKALELMGVKPVRIYLRVLAAISDGLLFTEEVLGITKEDVEGWLREAATYSFNLAYNTRYPTPQTLPYFLAEARQKALNLAINAGIVNEETIGGILARAQAAAMALASRLPPEALDEKTRNLLGSMATATETKDEGNEKEEEKEEEEGGEEEAAAGLASLFG